MACNIKGGGETPNSKGEESGLVSSPMYILNSFGFKEHLYVTIGFHVSYSKCVEIMNCSSKNPITNPNG